LWEYSAKHVTLNLALRSSDDARRVIRRGEAAATLVAGRQDKMRIVEETLAPGAKATEVARRNGNCGERGVHLRRQARTVEKTGACFTPVRIDAADAGAEDVNVQAAT
jgi:hypothetical protein